MLLHILRCTLHVHHDIRNIQIGNRTEHIIIHFSGSYIIDNCHTVFLDTHSRHIRPKGIYRNNRIGLYFSQNTQPHAQAFHLFRRRHILRIGTRRVSAHIDDSSSFRHNLPYAACYVGFRLHAAAGIKRIGGDIENSHDAGRRKVQQRTVDVYIFGLQNFHGSVF